MGVEEILVSISGGAPWGFRLQGGAEEQKPLQVAKVRRRSKACRAGLKEWDELVAIGDHVCAELSHAQAMSLIDKESATLNLRIKRTASEYHPSPCTNLPASPLSSIGVLLSNSSCLLSPMELPRGVTSPPDSEAYYGETDSDADTRSHTHQRRQRRTPPCARCPGRYDNQEEETSEMSGYESATDAGVTMQRNGQGSIGVPRRELIFLPQQTGWTTPAHTPYTLTPHTLTPTPDQGPVDAEGEGDSGFQEAGGYIAPACPPLVSPERAKEALKLSSSNHLVPMVGPLKTPVNEDLSTTYMDKARQAKLQRGESVVEKQVKEARSKCRSIASLLTDAPNPNSKGVLMFKKRRQRAKKYTLTCFGKALGDRGGETEGETGGETEEEGGSSHLSGSEVDEEGYPASFDPTWDSGYLELLDKRSSACPSTTPITIHSTEAEISALLRPGLLSSEYQSKGLEISGLESSPDHSSRVERGITNQPIKTMSPPAVALTNGGSVVVSRASVVLSPPSDTPLQSQKVPHSHPDPYPNTDLHSNSGFNPSVLNRTARPFTPGSTPSHASVTSVMFRPPQPKPTPLTMSPKPMAAVSVVTISPTQPPCGSDTRRAVSSTSLYIPPRNNNSNTSPSVCSPPSALSSPSSLASIAFSHPPSKSSQMPPLMPAVQASPSAPASPSAAQSSLVRPSPAQTFSPSPHPSPAAPAHPSPSACISPSHMSSLNSPPDLTHLAPSATHPILSPSAYIDMTGVVTPTSPPQAPIPDSLTTREQRISVPAARTGILHNAHRCSNKKPMFSALKSKDVSPNPDLMSMVQNMDGGFERAPCVESAAPSAETGHESGPEEDWLRLGAEACNFMQAQQAQRGHRPPPVAPKPQSPQVLQLAGKGGQLFARRQNRMDRYIVERSPSAAAAPYSPAQTREPSPTPSLPATWKYSPNIRAPPPINYNPLLSPSCPLKAQKKPEVKKSKTTAYKGHKADIKPMDIMSHQPYQLNSSLFSYGGGVPQDTSIPNQQRGGPQKTARVCEVKRFSTPPPKATGPTTKVIAPRSATTLGEPLSLTFLSGPPPPCHLQFLLSPLPRSLSSLPSPLLLHSPSPQLLHRPTVILKVPQISVLWAQVICLSRDPAPLSPPGSPSLGSALPTWVCSLAYGVLGPLPTKWIFIWTEEINSNIY
uniref:Synaptopodin 2-like protein n=1 Tax=Nothobranchius furzeri TaxID=105023 RepID=A0A8C6M703_NOTFU